MKPLLWEIKKTVVSAPHMTVILMDYIQCIIQVNLSQKSLSLALNFVDDSGREYSCKAAATQW